jgi:hypothetical protein
MAAELTTVLEELAALTRAGLEPVLFGGWAKELLGIHPAWPHDDLDVLVTSSGIDGLEQFIVTRGAEPFAPKRHAHKRAYESAGMLVELFLVRHEDGQLVTDFYGRYRRVWSRPVGRPLRLAGRTLSVATPDTISAYERDHRRVQDAMFAAHPGLREEFIRRYGQPYIPGRRLLAPESAAPGSAA